MNRTAAPVWDLEAIFVGGIDGTAFRDELGVLKTKLESLIAYLPSLPPIHSAPLDWQILLEKSLTLYNRIGRLTAFAGCWAATHSTCTQARLAHTEALALVNQFDLAGVPIKTAMDALSDSEFAEFVAAPNLVDLVPSLVIQRASAALRLPADKEVLLAELQPHANQGWGQVYNLVAGRLKATLHLPGEESPQTLSMSQLSGYGSSKDEAVRAAAHHARESAWRTEQDLCAMALGHITTGRLKRNERCNVGKLTHTLRRNRVQEETLHAMWTGGSAAYPALDALLDRKATLLNKKRLDIWDISAPLPNSPTMHLSWDEARSMIMESFHQFDPHIADFAKQAFQKNWIEAEARPGKRQGGFCCPVPIQNESRIFMTFNNTFRSALTLAHELGHAWHNHVLFDQPSAQRNVVSCTAESASTLAEALLRDHLLTQAESSGHRLAMLNQQLISGVVFLKSIRGRFLFESELYDIAKRGPFDPVELSEVMERCQQAVFGGQLNSWNPMGWTSVLHYYISQFGFYNWPYTFGYLFSGYIYEQAKAAGPSYLPTLRQILIQTGYRETEDIAQDVLGVDLADPKFWEQTVQSLIQLSDVFLEQTQALTNEEPLIHA